MKISKRLLGIFLFCWLLSSTSYAAEFMQEMKTTAIKDIQTLYKDWKINPHYSPAPIVFSDYLYNKRKDSSEIYRIYFNKFTQDIYQPYFVLPGGGFIMRAYKNAQENLVMEVDIDGEPFDCNSDLEQIKVILNSSGEVYVAE